MYKCIYIYIRRFFRYRTARTGFNQISRLRRPSSPSTKGSAMFQAAVQIINSNLFQQPASEVDIYCRELMC